jgi:hypothetical protein
MKTIFVFAYNEYYPGGGMFDFKNSFFTEEEARNWIKETKLDKEYDYVEIEDISQHLI